MLLLALAMLCLPARSSMYHFLTGINLLVRYTLAHSRGVYTGADRDLHA